MKTIKLLLIAGLLSIQFTQAQNKALNFNGTSTYVTTTTFLVPSVGNFTAELWVYATAGGLRHFISQGQGGTAFFVGMSATSNIWLGDSWVTSIPMPLNVWTHLAVVRNGTNGTLYVNGVQRETKANYTIGSGGTEFRIGKQFGAINEFTSGNLDAVRIWNTARSASQIKDGMYGTIPVSSTGLVAYYKMDEGSGTVVSNNSTSLDAAASSNGTLISGTGWLDNSPVRGNENGLHFDGVDDYVQIPRNSNYDFNSGTIECWLRTENLVGNACILGNRSDATSRYSFHIAAGSIGMYKTGEYQAIAYTFTPGQWYHLAFVCSAVETRIYVNGVSIGTTGNVISADANLDFQLGVAHTSPIFEPFSGSMDEVRIWNVTKTQAQIAAGMNLSLTGAEPNLVGLFAMDQGNIAQNNVGLLTLIDKTNINNHGTLQNFNLTGNSSNYIAHSTAVSNPAPVINSFSPATGPYNTAITISGNNFNTTPANNIVYFGGSRAIVTAASTTSLTVNVPVSATNHPISVVNTANNLAGYSNATFVPTFAGSNTVSFAPAVNFNAGNQPTGVSFGDIDGDNKLDMIVANQASNTISVFKNASTGSISTASYPAKVDFAVGGSPQNVIFQDVDGDGKPEIVVMCWGGGAVHILRNTSTPGVINSSSFAPSATVSTGLNSRTLKVADLNGDGKPEIITSNYVQPGSISLIQNNSTPGTLSFSSAVNLTAGLNFGDVAIADMDGDNKPEIIGANLASNNMTIFHNTHSGGNIATTSFASQQDFATGLYPWGISIGDIDGDNKPDVVIPNSGSSRISVFRNNFTQGVLNSSSLNTVVNFTTGLSPYSVAMADINGDGKLDIVTPNTNGTSVSVLLNTATPGVINSSSLTARTDIVTGLTSNYISVADIEGDGKPDIIVPNTVSGQTTVSILPNTIQPMILPVSITEFNAVKTKSSVILKWNTLSENNSAHFEIEKSINGSDFSSIGRVKAAGTSITKLRYEMADQNPVGGYNYYRLKSVDRDGKITRSESLIVKWEETVSLSVSLYPQPMHNTLRVNFNGLKISKGRFEIFDVNGKLVKSYLINNSSSTGLDVDRKGMITGLYFYRLTGENKDPLATGRIIVD
ncbi:FG-GAP-like repeat-containing protein [Flavitalea sp.]|nr:LamG-like jellyroll fold domain-containing protein [Flavitalea sp.]